MDLIVPVNGCKFKRKKKVVIQERINTHMNFGSIRWFDRKIADISVQKSFFCSRIQCIKEVEKEDPKIPNAQDDVVQHNHDTPSALLNPSH